VAVRLRSPSVLALPALAHESTVILAPSAFDAADEVTAVIGTGPYKVKAATEQEVAVESWDGWAGARPRIRRARYLSASRPETRALLAESGQADAVFDLDWPSESRLRGRPELSVMDVPSPRTTVLKVNSGPPFLADVRARRALSLAVDRQGIAKGIFGNPDRAATQLLPAFFPDWRVEGLEPL
jgi:peptide/nickel transport system substrate-binding protein